jgi:ERCC4-type nuclease
MGSFLIAPSEPTLIKTLGTVSSTPEKYGADILWTERAMGGLIGVQRKEISDLVASVQDGRLSKEVQQLRACSYPLLIVEGMPHWSSDGQLVHRWTRWTRAQHRSLLRSLQMRGITVEQSDNTADTVSLIEQIASWAAKDGHTTLDRRPKAQPDAWGQLTDEMFASHLLQSIQGIGPKQAKAVWDYFHGLPIGLLCSRDDLMKVKGLGVKKVDAIVAAFSGVYTIPP